MTAKEKVQKVLDMFAERFDAALEPGGSMEHFNADYEWNEEIEPCAGWRAYDNGYDMHGTLIVMSYEPDPDDDEAFLRAVWDIVPVYSEMPNGCEIDGDDDIMRVDDSPFERRYPEDDGYDPYDLNLPDYDNVRLMLYTCYAKDDEEATE